MSRVPRRFRSALPLLVMLPALLATGAMPAAAAAPSNATTAAAAATFAPAAPAWDGSFDLYRKGTFTTQKTWLWCTAAGVQIVRNIVERDEDHSTRAQRDYFAWMRRHNRYDLPEAAGVDPAGWTAGLRHFVDDRYRLVASKTFDAALRSAAARLRETELPVALTVANGGHGWIMTGFSATADPLVTKRFTVTSVRVVGPLYGRQSRNGYDMKPGTSLTPKELRRFFTPWRYAPKPMVWDGKYVSIQPMPRTAAAVPATPERSPSATPEPSPSAAPSSPLVAGVVPTPRSTANLPAAPTSLVVPPQPRAAQLPPTASSEGAPWFVILPIAGLGFILALAFIRAARRS